MAPREPLRLQDATVGVITALPKEYAAVRAALACESEIHAPGNGAGRRYALAAIPASGGGQHVVAVALLTDVGNNFAAIRATLMAQHCSLRHIIMTGIAGAIPNPAKADEHVRLGDLVISDRNGVVQYDFDKESIRLKQGGSVLRRAWIRIKECIGMGTKIIRTPAEFYEVITEHRHAPRPPSAELIEAARSLETRRLQNEFPWDVHIERVIRSLNDVKWTRPVDGRDRLRDWHDNWPETPHPEDRERRAGHPRLFYGTIASANKLLKNPVLRDALRDKFKAKAVEMESSGVADATWSHAIGYFVVRGTCDYCNPDKGDDWQEYAAVIAACYTRCVIEATAATTPASTALNNSGPTGSGAASDVLSKETELARAERIRAERDQEVSRYFIGEIGSLRSQLAKQAPQRVALPPHSTQPTKTDIGESVEPPVHPLPSATAAQDLNSQFLQRESSLVNSPQTNSDDPIEILCIN
jgi:nucleoside phosphorylase